jgi:hypothetical protein
MNPQRMSPQEVRNKVQSGKALLVCGYEEDVKFNKMKLEGGISLNEFEKRIPELPKEQEIIFYCG